MNGVIMSETSELTILPNAAPNHNTDGQIHDISPHGELLEFVQDAQGLFRNFEIQVFHNGSVQSAPSVAASPLFASTDQGSPRNFVTSGARSGVPLSTNSR